MGKAVWYGAVTETLMVVVVGGSESPLRLSDSRDPVQIPPGFSSGCETKGVAAFLGQCPGEGCTTASGRVGSQCRALSWNGSREMRDCSLLLRGDSVPGSWFRLYK